MGDVDDRVEREASPEAGSASEPVRQLVSERSEVSGEAGEGSAASAARDDGGTRQLEDGGLVDREQFLAGLEERTRARAERRRSSTIRMAELAKADRFDPPCHFDCDGEIRYRDPDTGHGLSGVCPLRGQEPPCLIPGQHRRARNQDLAELGWPARYLDESVWDACEVEAELRTVPASDGILILGPTGTGKTSAAALLAMTRWPTQRWGYVYWRDLVNQLGDAGVPPAARLQHLVIDDYGVGEIPPWKVGDVDGVWEFRNSRRLRTIVTSNLTRAQLTDDKLAARWVDRWRQMMPHVVTVGGRSRR